MRVAALQFDVRRGDAPANLAEVERGLREAKAVGVELVLLPEMWPTSFATPEEDRAALRAATAGARRRVEELARELGLWVGGSMFGFELDPPTNRFELVGPRGIALGYDKLHLFTPTAEPAAFSAGRRPPEAAHCEGKRLSAVVCYDLRFAELLVPLFLEGIELLLVPCQWPSARAAQLRALALGTAAWMQAFVLVSNRIGGDTIGRRRMALDFGGGSLLVDPRGRVLAEGGGGRELVSAELDFEDLRALRSEVPVRRDRRPEGYGARVEVARKTLS
jgi:predicted amidohydrolase